MRDNSKINLDNSFTKAVLTGLFLGISCTLLCFAYATTYRSITSFYLSSFINVTWIIFGCNLTLLTAGIVYSGFKKKFRYGNLFFLIFFVGIALLGLWKVGEIQRSNIPIDSEHFRGLLSGIIIILTIGIIFIPFLYRNKKFEDLIIGKPEI